MTPRQVGGMQEAFIQIRWKSMKGVEQTVAAVEKMGGRVLHAYPPSLMVVSVPANKTEKLVGKAGIVAATTERFEGAARAAGDEVLTMAMEAWNAHFSDERRERALASPTLDRGWDAGGPLLPPDPPPDVMEQLRQRERAAVPAAARAAAFAGAPIMSIPVLVGRVAVGVVFVDSTVAAFQITDAEKSKIVTEVSEGLNMLSSFEPRANIQWFYDFKRPKITLPASAFTNANKNSWEDLWRNAAMQAMGYAASYDGMVAYANSIKASNAAGWGYAIFVTKYPKDWFGYEWGNHVVMDFTVDNWGIDNFNLVVAHETGHVFGCPDEYGSSGCNCTQLGGRYQIANGNCQPCATNFVPCLMCSNSQAVCDYTRGHLGWNELAVQSRGTTTLKGTWTFDFDTGVQGSSTGSDIWWEQVNNVTRYLVPQGGAMLANLGQVNFDAVSLQTLQTRPYTMTPINGSNNASNQLTAGTVVAIKTGAGRYAKMKINSYGYNLGMTWVTYK
jgi:hypothetical protein